MYLLWGFPGGAVVTNPPANAGDMGSSPGPGSSHMPWSNKARVPQLLSLHSRAREPHLLSPRAQSPCSTTKEAITTRSLRTAVKSSPHSRQLKPTHSNKDPMQPKINKLNKEIKKKKECTCFKCSTYCNVKNRNVNPKGKKKEKEKRKVLRTKHKQEKSKLHHLFDFISQFPPTTLPHELVTLPD